MFPIKDNIPTERFPWVTVILIAINVVVFLGFQGVKGFSSVNEQTVVKYGAIPYELTHWGKHCDLAQVAGTGTDTVACEGTPGVTGKAPDQPPTWLTMWGQVLFSPNAEVPTIGASGAIAAVLGGYILLYPRARVLTLVFIVFFVTVIELPAVFMLGLWFLEQIYFGAADLSSPTGGGGGVAYWAHIGGFLFGLAAIRAFATRDKQVPPRYPVY